MRGKISFKTTKLYLLTVLFSSTLFANSCPKWAPIVMDDILTIIPIYPSSITAQDSDCDGVSDVDEQANGTNPNNPDTDGDGVNDYRDDYPLNPNLSTDTRAPVITLNSSSTLTVYRYIPFLDPGVTAQDDRDGTVSVQISGSVNTHIPGTYHLTYTASDSKGNTSTRRRTVIVKAEVRPQITLDPATSVDSNGSRPANAVDTFIKAFVADDRDRVKELTGHDARILSLLYDNPDATLFLTNIYKNVYLIEEKQHSVGDVTVSITFIDIQDNNTTHQGGFILVRSNVSGGSQWIVRQLY